MGHGFQRFYSVSLENIGLIVLFIREQLELNSQQLVTSMPVLVCIIHRSKALY